MKRVISLCLAVCMLLALSVNAFAYTGGVNVKINNVDLTSDITVTAGTPEAAQYGLTAGSFSLDTTNHTLTLDGVVISVTDSSNKSISIGYAGENIQFKIKTINPSKLIGDVNTCNTIFTGSSLLEIIGTVVISNSGINGFDGANISITSEESESALDILTQEAFYISGTNLKVKSIGDIVYGPPGPTNGISLILGSTISNSTVTVEAPGIGITMKKNSDSTIKNLDINNSNIIIKGGEYGLVTLISSYNPGIGGYETIEGTLNITGGKDNYIKAEGSIQAFKISTDTDKLNAPAEYVTLITNAGTKGYIGAVTEDGEPAAVEVESEPVEADVVIGGKEKTISYGNKTVVIGKNDIGDGNIDLTSANVEINNVILKNDAVKSVDNITIKNRNIWAVINKIAKVNNSINVTLTEGNATYNQKKAMNGEVIAQVTYACTSNGKTVDTDAVIYVKCDSETAKVYYVIDENTIGEWTCEVNDGVCSFPRYKDGTYVVVK